MPRHPAAPIQSQALEAIKQALDLCKGCMRGEELNPAWDPTPLGESSLLATPYFLGRLLDNTSRSVHSPKDRGQNLALCFFKIAQALPEKDRRTINAYYFERRPSVNASGVARLLGMSEATLYGGQGRLSRAINHLVEEFFQQIAPPLRPEPISCAPLIGRDDWLVEVLSQLRVGHTVALIGPPGVGKTALATAVACQWGAENVLRYTVRSALTDSVGSFMFALAYFLQQHGGTSLWAQIVAEGGLARNFAQLQGLLQYDLQVLQTTAPCLLWVDDVHELQPQNPLLALLETLQGQVAMLWTGRSPLPLALKTPIPPLQLAGWSLTETAAWLAQHHLALSTLQTEQLHTLTGGNPQHLQFWHTLFTLTADEDGALTTLQTPSAAALFAELWHKHLGPDERTALQYLAVFRRPAPNDVVPPVALEKLTAYHLAQLQGAGQVALPTAVRQWVLERTSATEQQSLHLKAAQVYVERGEYTEAAYHYAAGGEPTQAIQVWFPQRQLEYSMGQAPAAFAVFKYLHQPSLKAETARSMWFEVVNELAHAVGEPIENRLNFASVAWPSMPPVEDPLQLQTEIQSTPLLPSSQASDTHRPAPISANAWEAKNKAYLHQEQGYIKVTVQHDLEAAQREAALAQANVEKMFAQVAEMQDDVATAHKHYAQALGWAERSRDMTARAQAHNDLGDDALRLSDIPTAIAHLEQAAQLYHELGEEAQVLQIKISLGTAYLMGQHYAQARDLLRQATQTFQTMQATVHLAASATNLAEACYYLGELGEAEHYALLGLSQEDEINRAYALTILGHLARTRQRYTEAANFYEQAIEAAQNTADLWAEGFAWRGLGENCQAQRQTTEAQIAFIEALQCFTQIGAKTEIERTQPFLEMIRQ